jgi:hypothetical protein
MEQVVAGPKLTATLYQLQSPQPAQGVVGCLFVLACINASPALKSTVPRLNR